MSKTKKKLPVWKGALRAGGAIVLSALLVVGGYAGYVFGSYSRIEDNVTLEVRGKASAKQVETGKTYTVFSQNIGFGAYTPEFTFFMDGGTQSRAESKESVLSCTDQAIEKAKSFAPDFVLYQEVDTDSTRSHHVDQSKRICDALTDYSSVFAVNYHSAYLMYPLLEPHGASNSGMLTLSSVEITSSIRRSLPISTSVSKILDLDRCYSLSRMKTDNGKELVLFNVHTSAYGGSPEIREGQMTMLFTDMKAEYDKGNYVVCGGDYNHDFTGDSIEVLNDKDTPRSDWAQPFPAELLKNYPGISRALNYTCGEQRPTCRDCDIPYKEGNFTIIVDGFLVSDNVSVEYLENVQTGFAYSDHNPVVMQFSLQE